MPDITESEDVTIFDVDVINEDHNYIQGKEEQRIQNDENGNTNFESTDIIEKRNELHEIMHEGTEKKTCTNRRDQTYLKKTKSKTTVQYLSEITEMRTELQKKKIDIVQQNAEKELELRKTELDFQKEQWKQKLELEREKIASNEKLEQLRIEKEERVAKYEIEYRYKNLKN